MDLKRENSSRDSNLREVIDAYVRAHNDGVLTKNFGPLFGLFRRDIEMQFEGRFAARLIGLDAVVDAFRSNPPSDSLKISAVRECETEVVAEYCWASKPKITAGNILLEVAGGLISRILVSQP